MTAWSARWTSQSTGADDFDLPSHIGQKGSRFNVVVHNRTRRSASDRNALSNWRFPAVTSAVAMVANHAVVAETLAQNCPDRPKMAGSVYAMLSPKSVLITGLGAG
jgi:hypothetical protein